MRPNDIVEVLYGTETYLWKTVAYCKYHKCYLTAKQICTKKCLYKQCKALDKFLDRKFWKDRELRKLNKKKNIK